MRRALGITCYHHKRLFLAPPGLYQHPAIMSAIRGYSGYFQSKFQNQKFDIRFEGLNGPENGLLLTAGFDPERTLKDIYKVRTVANHQYNLDFVWYNSSMAYQPWNLLLRFILELITLAAFGIWGWINYGWLMAICAPIVIAGLWGVFAVPDDPSRSGRALVPIPDLLRLILELAILYGAAWLLKSVEQGPLALALVVSVTFHYILSYDRLAWLARQRPGNLRIND